jgi:hypothetical protein
MAEQAKRVLFPTGELAIALATIPIISFYARVWANRNCIILKRENFF